MDRTGILPTSIVTHIYKQTVVNCLFALIALEATDRIFKHQVVLCFNSFFSLEISYFLILPNPAKGCVIECDQKTIKSVHISTQFLAKVRLISVQIFILIIINCDYLTNTRLFYAVCLGWALFPKSLIQQTVYPIP